MVQTSAYRRAGFDAVAAAIFACVRKGRLGVRLIGLSTANARNRNEKQDCMYFDEKCDES